MSDSMNPARVSQYVSLGLFVLCLSFVGGCKIGTVHVDSNPWFAAGSFGKQADIDLAVSSGASVNAHESKERYTPVHVAAMSGNTKAMHAMIANGADINAVDEDGRTALMMALFRQQAETSVALVQAGADLEARDKRKKNALMFAAEQGVCDAIVAIAKRGADLNAQDRSGSTALMLAVLKGQREAVASLLAAGADDRLRDRKGRTALDISIAVKKPDIAALLRDQ